MEKFKDRVKLGVSPSTEVSTLEPLADWIMIEWHYEDVLEVRPDLTPQQARYVLHRAHKGHDADMGINWEVLICVAEIYYPEKERNYE